MEIIGLEGFPIVEPVVIDQVGDIMIIMILQEIIVKIINNVVIQVEFKVDGIKLAIIPIEVIVNATVIIVEEAGVIGSIKIIF